MVHGLKVGPFIDALIIKPPKSIADIRAKAIGYINIEKMIETKRA